MAEECLDETESKVSVLVGLTATLLPIGECGGVNAETVCHAPKGEAQTEAGLTESFGEVCGVRERIVPEEGEDGGQVGRSWLDPVVFPKVQGAGGDAEATGCGALEQGEVVTSMAKVIADGPRGASEPKSRFFSS